MGRLFRLDVTTWVGQAWGAQHWYAELQSGVNDPLWRIERAMNRQDIVKLNKARRDMGAPVERINPGEWCNGFDSEADAIEAATAVFKHMSRDGDSLEYDTLLQGPTGNKYDYGDGVIKLRTRRSAVVKRTADGWEFVELEER